MLKIIIAGTSVYGIENQGDDAMLSTFTREIKANASDAEVVLLARYPSEQFNKLYFIDRAIQNLDHKSKEASMGRWFNGLNPGDDTTHLQTILKEIQSADLLVIGGDPFAEITMALYRGLAPQAALLITLAKFAGTPVMLYGIHMGRPLKTEMGIELTKYCVKNANLLTAREEFTRKVFTQMGIDGPNVEVLADTAFGLNPIEDKATGAAILKKENIRLRSDNVIGVCFRHMYWTWNVAKWATYCQELAAAFDALVEKTGAEILFVPNCTFDLDYKYEDDRPPHADIAAAMSHKESTHQVKGKYNLYETLSLFRHFQMAISNRRHFLVFGAVNHLPPVAIGTESEWHTKPAMDDLGLGEYFLRIEDLNRQNLLATAECIWQRRREIGSQIATRLPGLRQKAIQHGKLAVDLARRLRTK